MGRAVGLAAGAAAGCFAWGLAESAMFTVRRVTVPVLPPGGRDLSVLHISDIHLTTRQHFKLDFVRSWAALKPDLVINTGDNISEAGAVFPLMAAFNQLRFTPGVFVFGSNDYFAPTARNPLAYLKTGRSHFSPAQQRRAGNLPTAQLREKFTAVGWKDLNQQRATLEVGGYRLAFRGTDDAHLSRDQYHLVAGPAEDADLNIGVTHAPYRRLLDPMTEDGMDLIFAGHTHGGQVCVPGYGALITNCDIDKDRVKGLSRHSAGGRTSYLHVSAGVGTSPFAPYRFACRPEVTLLTLVPKA